MDDTIELGEVSKVETFGRDTFVHLAHLYEERKWQVSAGLAAHFAKEVQVGDKIELVIHPDTLRVIDFDLVELNPRSLLARLKALEGLIGGGR